MKEEIKEILEDVKRHLDYVEAFKQSSIRDSEMKAMYDYITNLQEEKERLKKGYCELKVKCNNGECDCTNEEYDGMVQANIKLSLKYDKALELLSDFNMPCEYDEEKIPNDYCEKNCEVSDEIYKKCWDKYIELVLQGEDTKESEVN